MVKLNDQFFIIGRGALRWISAVILIVLCNNDRLVASHAMGADLTYTCLGGNQYEVTYSFYRYCDGIPAPSTFTVNVVAPGCSNANLNVILNCTNFNNPTEISPVCPTATSNCNGGTFIGVQEYIYTGIITLPAACANWTLSVSECCRNSTITTVANPSGYNLFLYSTLNNTSGICNNSPTFANNPVPFACTGQRFCFNHGAFDVDGDSLVYQLITPRSGPAAADTVSYVAGYSASQPVLSQPGNPAVQVRFDPVTGDMCMDPIQADNTVFAVLVSEYRNGVLIGQVERDIQLSVLACSNRLPLLSGINGLPSPQPYTINACAGSVVNFFIASIDPDPTNSTYLNWDYAIPGATFTTYGGSNAFGGHRDSARFTWIPTVGDIGHSNCFTVSASDDNCPILGTTYSSYCINVIGVDVDAGADVSVSCGQCTSLTATPVGGTGPYTYTWNPGNVQSATLSPACVGQYIVSIRDNSTCTNTDTINVIPSAGSIAAAFNATSNCSGAPVQFTDQSSGGAVNSWSWTFGDGGTSNLQNPTHQYASNGNYNVTLIITAAGGCIDTVVQQITIATNIPVAQIAATNVCQGTTMNFSSNASTGGPIATYAWDFGDPGSGASNTDATANPSHYFITPGTYTVTLDITNTAGCSDNQQQTVTVYANPTCSVPPQQICAGQQAVLSAPAGFSSYAWSNGGNSQTISVSPANTATYTITVTDANNCSVTSNTQVNVNPVPVANAGTNQTICAGTSTNLTASGGSAGSVYTWSPGSLGGATVTVTPAITTRYTVEVTSGAGCSSTASVTVDVNPMPQVSADNDAAICKGTSIIINANSGTANYSWQPGSLTGANIAVTPLVTTTYTVTVSDAIGCSGSDQITITVNPLPAAAFSSDAPQCEGFSVSFSDASSVPTGSVSAWSWDFANGQTSQTQNPASQYSNSGNYNVRLIVTSDGGCKDTIENAIIINATPVVDAGVSQDICPGGSASLTASGGSQYSWSPGGFSSATINVSPAVTTDYTVTVTDANGCINSDAARIAVQPVPVANAGTDQSICYGESTSLVASGGDTYLWSPGNVATAVVNITPSATATYTVIAQNTFGCRDTDDVQVRVNPLPIASFAQTGPVCQSIPVSFTDQSSVGTGTISAWNWDLGNNIISTNQDPQLLYSSPGNYTVRLIVTTSDGCRDTVSEPLSIYAEPVAEFTSVDVCDGLPVQFTDVSTISDATPLSYSWDLGDNSMAYSQSFSHTYGTYGTYPVTLVVASNRNCRDSISRLANVFALPDAAFVTDFTCTDEPADFMDQSVIPQGLISNWFWQFGDGSVESVPNPQHIYNVPGYYDIDLLVTSDHGCLDSTNGLIRVVPLPMADFETQDVCFGLESPLSDLSSSPTGSIVSYSWNFGDGRTSTDQNNLHQYAAPGFYQVSLTVTTDSGCVNTLVRPNALQVYAPPPASFLDNAVLASDIYPIVNFTNQTGTLGTYSWDFGDGALSTEYSPTHEYASIGIYEVQMIAIDLNGCVDTLLRSIEIRPTSNVYIPNSFTPNGDLKNDLFQVYTYNVVSVNSQIFDRWGLEIFTWDGVSGGWDGTIEGQPVQNDVYVYRIVTTDVNNKREVHVGHVSLVR